MKIKTTKKGSFIKRTSSERKKQVLSFFMPILFLMLVCSILFTSCKEEVIGQYPVDNTPPQKISNLIVTNTKGGATIKYDLPQDKDILYVKATYKLSNGVQKETVASAFVNELTIRGFARSAKTNVRLVTVDKSRNESEPVEVEIEPLNSPIFDIYESLSVIAGFGGIKLTWENPEKESVVIGILSKNDEDNSFISVENFYTTVEHGIGAVRGMESKETEFGIFVRDIYYNYTDTLLITLTPWEESELDKGLWRGMPLCPSFKPSQWGGPITKLWDGLTIVDNTDVYYLNTTSERIFFTIDLGVTAKLSRFKFWGRNNWYFNLHHPKEFEIWGTDDPVVANGDACSWEGWELLLTGTSEKPSGPEPTAFANLTSEDLALARGGEEFEFPLEAPQVRYIRFRTLRTWTNSNSSFIGELTFWGQTLTIN